MKTLVAIANNCSCGDCLYSGEAGEVSSVTIIVETRLDLEMVKATIGALQITLPKEDLRKVVMPRGEDVEFHNDLLIAAMKRAGMDVEEILKNEIPEGGRP
jgi:hypothetical protein